MTRLRATALIASFFLLIIVPSAGRAAWQLDGNGFGTGVGSIFFIQGTPVAVSDGAGGAIIVWQHDEFGFGSGPYYMKAQRVDAFGVAQWTVGGVTISTLGSGNSNPSIVSDGAGGAIIEWFVGSVIAAQRVNGSGVVQWTAGGVLVCAGNAAQAVICSDNAGGAITAWADSRNGPDDIYAQRINSAGSPQWTANGVAVHTVLAGSLQGLPQVAADGSGGVFVTWQDNRSGGFDIYVARLNSAGSLLSTPADGRPVCTAVNTQWKPAICSDGNGRAIVAWEDYRGGSADVYAQRINTNGNPMWGDVAISAVAGSQVNPAVLKDTAGGAFIEWEDNSVGATFVQRVNSLGAAAWAANGVSLGGSGATESTIVTDGQGGAIVAWQEGLSSAVDIYTRRINASGVPQWSAPVPLCTAVNNQEGVRLVSDGVGGAIAVWWDVRASATLNEVYAQRVERYGYWGYPSANIVNVRDVPGDQGGQVNLAWDASRLDPFPDELIDNYTVWRALDPSAAAAAMVAGGDDIRVQQINATTYYWQLIHTLGAYALTGYSDLVPTPFDSTVSSNEPIHFQVIAHAGSAQWISSPASGRSVDNIAPAAPLELAAQRVGADVHLVWDRNHEIDFDHYAVYRHTSTGVTPVAPYFLSSADDSVLVDASAPAGGLYYIVTAIDTHDNQSAKSNEASVSPVTGVGDAPRSFVLSVSNYPNPFNPRTTVSYTIPSRGSVTVSVYDARGARIATLFSGERTAGAYSVEWDGRTDGAAVAASGVYFARIEHASGTRSKKMLLLK